MLITVFRPLPKSPRLPVCLLGDEIQDLLGGQDSCTPIISSDLIRGQASTETENSTSFLG
jgi:hypothetical protein